MHLMLHRFLYVSSSAYGPKGHRDWWSALNEPSASSQFTMNSNCLCSEVWSLAYQMDQWRWTEIRFAYLVDHTNCKHARVERGRDDHFSLSLNQYIHFSPFLSDWCVPHNVTAIHWNSLSPQCVHFIFHYHNSKIDDTWRREIISLSMQCTKKPLRSLARLVFTVWTLCNMRGEKEHSSLWRRNNVVSGKKRRTPLSRECVFKWTAIFGIVICVLCEYIDMWRARSLFNHFLFSIEWCACVF